MIFFVCGVGGKCSFYKWLRSRISGFLYSDRIITFSLVTGSPSRVDSLATSHVWEDSCWNNSFMLWFNGFIRSVLRKSGSKRKRLKMQSVDLLSCTIYYVFCHRSSSFLQRILLNNFIICSVSYRIFSYNYLSILCFSRRKQLFCLIKILLILFYLQLVKNAIELIVFLLKNILFLT